MGRNSFIKATEFWLPSQDRSRFEYGGDLYGPGSRTGARPRPKRGERA